MISVISPPHAIHKSYECLNKFVTVQGTEVLAECIPSPRLCLHPVHPDIHSVSASTAPITVTEITANRIRAIPIFC